MGSITGYVKDRAGKPLIGAEVLIFNGNIPGSPPIASTTTNAAGHYLLQDVKVQHVTVRAAMRGFKPAIKYAHMPTQEFDASFQLAPDT